MTTMTQAGISCGNCKDKHATVADVRNCYGASGRFDTSFALPAPRTYQPPRVPTLTERYDAALSALPRDPDHYKTRYALDYGNGDVRFYVVEQPTRGRWVGHAFVKILASDTEYPLNKGQQVSVLEAIAADPKEALARFGRETVRCGHCGRRLTNQESRERGIGPICLGKLGW